jgi:hypothetical protein
LARRGIGSRGFGKSFVVGLVVLSIRDHHIKAIFLVVSIIPGCGLVETHCDTKVASDHDIIFFDRIPVAEFELAQHAFLGVSSEPLERYEEKDQLPLPLPAVEDSLCQTLLDRVAARLCNVTVKPWSIMDHVQR